ncbi:hypothetical protein BJX65DRAFT_304321 [Aspergillus insuetus]
MKHILDAFSQKDYEDATASLRSVLGREAPPLALADFDSDMLRTTFSVTRHPSIGEMLQVGEDEMVSLSRVIDPFLLEIDATATRGADEANELIQSRLDTILELSLTETQRFNVLAESSPLNPPPHMDALRWSMQNPISMSLTYDGRQRRLNGVLDYLLLWGARQHSETNLVVIAGKRVIESEAEQGNQDEIVRACCLEYAAGSWGSESPVLGRPLNYSKPLRIAVQKGNIHLGLDLLAHWKLDESRKKAVLIREIYEAGGVGNYELVQALLALGESRSPKEQNMYIVDVIYEAIKQNRISLIERLIADATDLDLETPVVRD